MNHRDVTPSKFFEGRSDRHSVLSYICLDNIPKYVACRLGDWLNEQETKTLYIDPTPSCHPGRVLTS